MLTSYRKHKSVLDKKKGGCRKCHEIVGGCRNLPLRATSTLWCGFQFEVLKQCRLSFRFWVFSVPQCLCRSHQTQGAWHNADDFFLCGNSVMRWDFAFDAITRKVQVQKGEHSMRIALSSWDQIPKLQTHFPGDVNSSHRWMSGSCHQTQDSHRKPIWYLFVKEKMMTSV